MSKEKILRLGTLKSTAQFEAYVRSLNLSIPCDDTIVTGEMSPLRLPIECGPIKIGNRITAQPMEGWDGTLDGSPTENTLRRWRKFGQSGAKLIWGGEAVAVTSDSRANPHQLVMAPRTEKAIAQLRAVLVEEHCLTTGSDQGLFIGLQLTHSGRFSRPHEHARPEPRIAYHHPILDGRLGLSQNSPLLTDSEIDPIIEKFCQAAVAAQKLGFDFVDIKHCHGYLAHEFLGAHTRAGRYGGSFENRTRFLREIVRGIRRDAPGLEIGVRLSACDTIPFRKGAASNHDPNPGIPEDFARLLPYRYGFGVNEQNPLEIDLAETVQFLSLLEHLAIRLVNVTAGSPYYNPHIQRPAYYPPSDGYAPPEDPLVGVARQMEVTRSLKQKFPNLIFVGSAYSYLQDFLPNVAQAAVKLGWVDSIGLGRMLLTYPEILWHATEGHAIDRKKICRTFSDCTTAPRNGLPSGCYPLDSFYKHSEAGKRLYEIKKR